MCFCHLVIGFKKKKEGQKILLRFLNPAENSEVPFQ